MTQETFDDEAEATASLWTALRPNEAVLAAAGRQLAEGNWQTPVQMLLQVVCQPAATPAIPVQMLLPVPAVLLTR